MTATHRQARRRRYAARAHDVAQRFARPDLPATPEGPTPAAWWRSEHGDHAFGGGSTRYLRSACGVVRWDVLMAPVQGTVHPCVGCLAKVDPLPIAPPTESELRAMDGNR